MEFSGLEPADNRILEVAVIITDANLKELATYHSSISHAEATIRKLLKKSPFWSQRPEEVEKVITDMHSGLPEKQVEKDLITLVEKYYMPGEAVYLAGNTIRMDRKFVDYWLKDFAKLLHYRMLDVTAFKLWWLGQGNKEFNPPKAHRALDDIRRSITELKYYLEHIEGFNRAAPGKP